MKRSLVTLAAILAVAGLALAQTSGAPPTSTPPAANTNQNAAAAQAPAKKAPPQAKTKEEYDAYVKVATAADAAAAEAAAREFEVQFPDSELKGVVYQLVMGKYQQADNADKTVEMGRKALQFDPTNVRALVLTASILSQRTLETDIDRDQKLNEAVKDAQEALKQVQSGELAVGPSVTPEQMEALKDRVSAMAYDAIGQAELVRKNEVAAEQSFRKALQTKAGQNDALVWLRLSLSLDHQGKYLEALEAANRSVGLAAPSSAVGGLAKKEQGRLQQLASAGPAGAKKESVPTAPEPEIVKPK